MYNLKFIQQLSSSFSRIQIVLHRVRVSHIFKYIKCIEYLYQIQEKKNNVVRKK